MIEWTQPNVYSVWVKGKQEPHKLMPGMNEISEDDWKNISVHPNAKAHISEGNLLVHEFGKKGAKSFKEYSVNDAKRIVKGTFDKDLLKKWAGEDSRKQVLEAIQAQIDTVDKSVKVKEKNNESDNDE